MTKKINNILYMPAVLLLLIVATGLCDCINDKVSKNKVSADNNATKDCSNTSRNTQCHENDVTKMNDDYRSLNANLNNLDEVCKILAGMNDDYYARFMKYNCSGGIVFYQILTKCTNEYIAEKILAKLSDKALIDILNTKTSGDTNALFGILSYAHFSDKCRQKLFDRIKSLEDKVILDILTSLPSQGRDVIFAVIMGFSDKITVIEKIIGDMPYDKFLSFINSFVGIDDLLGSMLIYCLIGGDENLSRVIINKFKPRDLVDFLSNECAHGAGGANLFHVFIAAEDDGGVGCSSRAIKNMIINKLSTDIVGFKKMIDTVEKVGKNESNKVVAKVLNSVYKLCNNEEIREYVKGVSDMYGVIVV